MRREHRTTLRDGTLVRCRPISSDDRELLADGFARLSERSRYLRFHTAMARLSEAQLRYLTDVDDHDHVAWVALDLSADPPVGAGVGRFVRLTDEPDVAEAAVTVIDEYQGRGLGTLLLGLLARSARERGVTTFRSYVLDENEEMLGLTDGLGGERVREQSEGWWRVDLPVPGAEAALELSAPKRFLRYVASLPERSRPQLRHLRSVLGTEGDQLRGAIVLEDEDLSELHERGG